MEKKMMVKNKRTNEILVTDDDGNSDLFVFHKKTKACTLCNFIFLGRLANESFITFMAPA